MSHDFQGIIVLTSIAIMVVSGIVTKLIIEILRLDREREDKTSSPAKDFGVMIFTLVTFVVVALAIAYAACVRPLR